MRRAVLLTVVLSSALTIAESRAGLVFSDGKPLGQARRPQLKSRKAAPLEAPAARKPIEAVAETAAAPELPASDHVSTTSVTPVREAPVVPPEAIPIVKAAPQEIPVEESIIEAEPARAPSARALLSRLDATDPVPNPPLASNPVFSGTSYTARLNAAEAAKGTPATTYPDPVTASRAATQRLIAAAAATTVSDARSPKRVAPPRLYAEVSPQITEEIITPQGPAKGAKKKTSPTKPSTRSAIEPGNGYEDARDPRSDGAVNAAFPYTHLLPSPAILPDGHLKVGTTVGVGITDYVEVSTNMVRNGFRMWNITAKVPLVEFPTFTATGHVTFDSFNLSHFDKTNPDLRVNSWQPGLTTGYEIGDDMAVFFGGNFNLANRKIPRVQTSGFERGARAMLEWSYLYNPRTSRLKDNAVSIGTDYDFSYHLWGLGITHHWPTFELGLHYTMNADNYRILPIFAFTTGFSF